ncbi:hypothetical protein BJV78DRAFT_908908 [Lactifluus subvellereus]|nr:hypothetical protein BJV78DRAFT_908908 [Lactifluus subvellereus]
MSSLSRTAVLLIHLHLHSAGGTTLGFDRICSPTHSFRQIVAPVSSRTPRGYPHPRSSALLRKKNNDSSISASIHRPRTARTHRDARANGNDLAGVRTRATFATTSIGGGEGARPDGEYLVAH